MSIYFLDNAFISENLTPPQLRTTKQLAWLNVILKPLSFFSTSIFNKYQNGDASTVWNSGTTYTLSQKVSHSDKAIYTCMVASSLNESPTTSASWRKINDLFIGANERIKYYSQKKLFEYALNRFFITTDIYIENNFIASDVVFLMANGGENSSVMPNSSVNQIHYMGNTPNYVTATNDFTIYVPTAFYNALGTYKEELIRAFANKYVLAGITYNCVPY